MIKRAFLEIAEGQVHYRTAAGPTASSSNPLWMIHASPGSSIGLSSLIREFGRSRRIIAPDTLGNGDSAAPAVTNPDIPYYAGATLRAMDALGLQKVDLYGSHTGAHICVEIALAHPERVGRMILDGIAMFSPDDKRDFLANYAPSIEPDAFGGQFHWAWHFVRDQGWFFPYFRRDVAHLRGVAQPSIEALHNTTVEVLKSIRTYHLAYRAAFAHDDRARLPLVRTPTLVMADDTDPLRVGVPLANDLLPGSQAWIFKDSARADAAAHKANVLAKFLDSGALES
jgi:pimeloyl-ACP methyl ester carboxylesterase